MEIESVLTAIPIVACSVGFGWWESGGVGRWKRRRRRAFEKAEAARFEGLSKGTRLVPDGWWTRDTGEKGDDGEEIHEFRMCGYVKATHSHQSRFENEFNLHFLFFSHNIPLTKEPEFVKTAFGGMECKFGVVFSKKELDLVVPDFQARQVHMTPYFKQDLENFKLLKEAEKRGSFVIIEGFVYVGRIKTLNVNVKSLAGFTGFDKPHCCPCIFETEVKLYG
jgi:hypothetical protein